MVFAARWYARILKTESPLISSIAAISLNRRTMSSLLIRIVMGYYNNTGPRGWASSAVPLMRTHFTLSLPGEPAHPELVERRGNLDEVEHTSANRRCYGNGIAMLHS